MSDAIDWDALVAAAFRARENAYAPYSRYRVGAALLSESGSTFVGANVENASYGLCLCAERSAVAAAIVTGARRFTAIAVVTGGAEPATPCGMCRQVLAELAPSMPVRCVAESGAVIESTTAALLPHAFTPAQLGVDPEGGDPLRSTMILGTRGEKLETDRPPPGSELFAHDITHPSNNAFVGVALKVAAGTGSELAQASHDDPASPDE